MKRRPQSGNMLVYILGAVFLLGILLVAIRSGYQPGAGIDAESAILKATQIQKYATELERGVSFIMQNGASETDIRFAHVSNPGTYGTPGDTPSRQIFEPTGGGVEWKAPPSGAQAIYTLWTFGARSEADGVGSTCAAAACVDIIAYLVNLTKDVCLALNNSIGITNPSGDAPVDPDAFFYTAPYDGTFVANGVINTTGDYTKNRNQGCVKVGSAYNYYRVLKAR